MSESLATSVLAGMAAGYNPRRISDHDLAALRRSLRFFGTVQPVIVNRRTNRIVGGHQRVRAALAEGIAEMPVVYVDLDEPSEKQLNLALNRVAGEWDRDALEELLRDLDAGGADLELTGFTDAELEELLGAAPGNARVPVDEDEAPEPEEEGVTQPGDLIVLGSHRLFCGDATKPEHVAALLAGATPGLMVTDPPYGVDYDPDWRNDAAQAGIGMGAPGGRAVGRVLNDTRADWREAWTLFPGDVAYVWHGALHAHTVADSLVASGFDLRAQIVWAKTHLVVSRGHYHWQHEPCWYAVRKGSTANWAGDRKQTTLWQIEHRKSETGHGTQKPVEAMRRPMENHTAPGDAVYDPFLGSGTSLIAAEQTGRVCYGLELDPRYCDVIVRRWQDLTGRRADGWRGND